MAYDWNPVTSASGSLPALTSVVKVTSEDDFKFSST